MSYNNWVFMLEWIKWIADNRKLKMFTYDNIFYTWCEYIRKPFKPSFLVFQSFKNVSIWIILWSTVLLSYCHCCWNRVVFNYLRLAICVYLYTSTVRSVRCACFSSHFTSFHSWNMWMWQNALDDNEEEKR